MTIKMLMIIVAVAVTMQGGVYCGNGGGNCTPIDYFELVVVVIPLATMVIYY